jgi:hypothetical protein
MHEEKKYVVTVIKCQTSILVDWGVGGADVFGGGMVGN